MKSLMYILPICLTVIVSANTDANSSDASITRDGYMPAIITPDELKSGFYGGLGLGAGLNNFKTSTTEKDLKTADFSLVAGYNFNQYIAAESRATISIANDNSIDYKKVSIFLKPKYEVYNGLNLYSLVGFGNFSANSITGESTKASKASLQLGLGADYKLGKNFKLFADYTYLGKDSKAKYNSSEATLKSAAITTGITYEF